LLDAERPQRSRTRFIGIVLAITSHFDDPLGNDFAVEGVTCGSGMPRCASQQNWPAHVRFVSGVDITRHLANVRFTLPPIADIDRRDGHVRLVPLAELTHRSKKARYSITSSARRRNDSLIWSPIVLAVLID